MSSKKIREQIEKIRSLSTLYSKLNSSLGTPNDKETQLKMDVAKKEMLKCTYKVGKLLKELEQKI
ncbi:hypothetical protein GOV08_01705 [Candidatus Woesearchaeota archaeon]|nr:hypothetical protein [Candidatus Woesearchaeota archaeon]